MKVFVAVTFLLCSTHVLAQIGPTFQQTQEIVAMDAAIGDDFGWSVALEGDTAIIGAWGDGDTDDYGSAYVYVRNADGLWVEDQKLQASDGRPDDRFGYSVAMDGGTAIIGAHSADNQRGSVYVFERNSLGVWIELDELVAADGSSGDFLGCSVAMDGDTAIVGAVDESLAFHVAYVFGRSDTGNWSEQAKLQAGELGAAGVSTCSVALDGDRAWVGSHTSRGESGAVYLYERDDQGSWVERTQLTPSDQPDLAHFGISVATSGDTVVIGAPRAPSGIQAGWAYVFGRQPDGSWREEVKLVASDFSLVTDLFGFSVAVEGDTAIVGSVRDDDGGSDSGSAFVFRKHPLLGWIEQQKLVPADSAARDLFGVAVALSGDTTLVSSWWGELGDFSGSTYVFVRGPSIDIKPGGEPNSVNPYSRGKIPVVVFGSPTFDVTQIDVGTIAFGPAGAMSAHLGGHLEDTNADEFTDLVLHFHTRETGIECGTESATLMGETVDGGSFESTDSIRTVGCRTDRHSIFSRPSNNRPVRSRGGGAATPQRK